jgi:hypothetical protein
MYPNMGAGVAGPMPGMGWGGQDMSAMAQFMPNAMGNFPNTMGELICALTHPSLTSANMYRNAWNGSDECSSRNVRGFWYEHE